MVALPKPPAEAEKGRRRLRREAKRKGKEPARESLEAAGYVFVFTTLARESFPAERVLDLYRLRWQVEMAIKRMKSILLLDAMAAKSAALCRTFLLGKLLAVLLVEDVANACGAFPPCGAQSSASVVPVAGVAGGV
jgi:hypothetical protein